MNFIGIIPARYSSSRLPGKPLEMIGDKTMLERVVLQCLKSKTLSKVVVATDDEKIFDHIKNAGHDVIMTSVAHTSGTDRCYEAAKKLSCSANDIIINIQGDEPFIDPKQIDLVASSFATSNVNIATLVKKINTIEELENPSIPKVSFTKNKQALLFSRSIIPFNRNAEKENWLNSHTYYKHIGIYGYRYGILEKIVQLEPSQLEKTESLEQLRWLENDYSIHITETSIESLAVDTPADLEKARLFAKESK